MFATIQNVMFSFFLPVIKSKTAALAGLAQWLEGTFKPVTQRERLQATAQHHPGQEQGSWREC